MAQEWWKQTPDGFDTEQEADHAIVAEGKAWALCAGTSYMVVAEEFACVEVADSELVVDSTEACRTAEHTVDLEEVAIGEERSDTSDDGDKAVEPGTVVASRGLDRALLRSTHLAMAHAAWP